MFHDNIFTASRGRTACLVAVLLGAPLVFYFTRETSEGANSASSPNARVQQHRVPPLKLTVMSSHDQRVVNLRGLDLTQPAIPDTITKVKETGSITEHRIKIEVTFKSLSFAAIHALFVIHRETATMAMCFPASSWFQCEASSMPV